MGTVLNNKTYILRYIPNPLLLFLLSNQNKNRLLYIITHLYFLLNHIYPFPNT